MTYLPDLLPFFKRHFLQFRHEIGQFRNSCDVLYLLFTFWGSPGFQNIDRRPFTFCFIFDYLRFSGLFKSRGVAKQFRGCAPDFIVSSSKFFNWRRISLSNWKCWKEFYWNSCKTPIFNLINVNVNLSQLSHKLMAFWETSSKLISNRELSSSLRRNKQNGE